MKLALSFCFLFISTYLYGNNSVDKMEFLLKQSIFLDKNIIIFKKNKEIFRPKGVWVSVINLENTCLFYRVPTETVSGRLTLVHKVNSCRDEYDQNILVSLDDVNSLIIKSKNKIEVNFSQRSKKYNLVFNSFALTRNSSVFYLGENEKKADKLKSNAICRSYDDDCEIYKDLCFQCPYSWFEIIHKKCPNKKIRKCGVNNCGSKGEVACADGRGLCAKGLRLEWNDKGALVCI